MRRPTSRPRGTHGCDRVGIRMGSAAALLVAMAVPATAAAADTGPDFLGTAADLGVDTPDRTSELSELTSSPTGAWFVELAPRPTARGGNQAQVEQAQQSFVAQAQAAGVDLEVRQTFSALWSGLSADLSDDDVEAVSELPEVKAVYPVLTIDAPERPANEPDLASALSMTGADITHSELGYDGEGIRVGIIDTGVDYDHPDLGGSGTDGATGFPTAKVVAGYDFVGDDYNADPASEDYQPVPMPDPDPDDCNGHGTHVAGIAGAQGDFADGGVRGVAPGVELGAYRVFGCEGSTESDIMIAAMERALADGMDVVNQSIGSAFSTWPQYPTAVASDNLVDAGVVMVASIGNSGAAGTWSAGAPGVGEDVIGVASYDNVAVTATLLEVDGEEHPYIAASAAPEPPTEGTLPLTRLGAPGTAEARACTPIETDLSGQAVLIERGAHPDPEAECDASFYAKALAAQEAGAAAVLLYNNAPGLFSATVEGEQEITIPVVGLSQEAGLAADAEAAAGGATLTWTDEVGSAPNPTAGLISDFSSYGLTADLQLKPDLGAPGGNIYSTYPLEDGAYNTISGTSMAAPHVAGAAALLLEARPDVEAGQVRDLLQNTADPATWSLIPDAGYTEPVHRQGAGMVDIDDTILATTSVTPGKLSLGESEGGPALQELTVTNDGDEPVVYELSSEDAVASADDPDNPGFYAGAADVDMPDMVTVQPGQTATVQVAIGPDAALDQAQYGGYIVFTAQDGGEVLRVPFAGFAGDYQALPLLEDLPGLDLPALAELTECERLIEIDCAAGGAWDLAGQDASYTMTEGDVPTIVLHLEHPAQSLTFTIFEAMPEGAGTDVVAENQAVARYEQYVGRDSGAIPWTWDGTRSNTDGSRSDVPDGRYVLEVRALNALGDPDNPEHVETWSTQVFTIDRDGDGEIPPLEPEEPSEPPAQPTLGFFLNDGWDARADHVFHYGRFTDEVLIGDWDGDDADTITLRRGTEFFVNNAQQGGPAEETFAYGRAGDVVLVGDWDGDGIDTLAVRRGNVYYLKNSIAPGAADQVVVYGRPGDDVLVGDWDNDGVDTLTVRRGSAYYVKNTIAPGPADQVVPYGRAGDDVLVGDWDGDGVDTLAVRRGFVYYVKNDLSGGPADIVQPYGRTGDEVYVGDWDGDSTDTLGVRRLP